jgi:putative peptide zinc metalloprotease protein
MWWPHPGAYRPIQPYEGGTLTQAVAAARPAPSGLVEGQYGRLVTGWADGDPRPTAERPQLALVLVPRSGQPADGAATTGGAAGTGADGSDGAATAGSGTDAASGSAGSEAPVPWVFPFDKPLEPGEGDNQALAVNTTDGTIQYDVAFALVWVEDDSPALNTNEAYAFASCTGCAAVSVGFQIVLVTGDNHVAVPQNISAAVNYDCVNCLTYALATQLFVTLDGPLSEGGVSRITEIWQRIAAFGAHITEVPLSDIRTTLTSFEQEILQVITEEQGPLGGAGSAQPADGPSGGPTAAVGSTPSDGSSPAASPGASPSAGASGSTGDGTGTAPDGTGGTTTDPGTGGTTTDPGTGGTTTTDPGGSTTTDPGGSSPSTGTSPAPGAAESGSSADSAAGASAATETPAATP